MTTKETPKSSSKVSSIKSSQMRSKNITEAEQELNEVLKNKGIDPTAYKESLNNPEVKTATEVEEESIKSEEE